MSQYGAGQSSAAIQAVHHAARADHVPEVHDNRIYNVPVNSNSGVRVRLRLGIAFAFLALAACGGSSTTATNPSPSQAAAATAPCTVAAVMVAVRGQYDTGGNHATVNGDGGLVCAEGIAKITVLVGPVNAPAGGPQGAVHLALLEDHGGTWVIANYTLCTVGGQPTKPIPPKLGIVCGFP
jgi:hypothetical protein